MSSTIGICKTCKHLDVCEIATDMATLKNKYDKAKITVAIVECEHHLMDKPDDTSGPCQ